MSNNLFTIPEWDADVPNSNFNFKNKKKNKTKKKSSPTSVAVFKNTTDVDNEPGRFVRINKTNPLKNTTPPSSPSKKESKKRKLNQRNGDNDEGADKNTKSNPQKKRKLAHPDNDDNKLPKPEKGLKSKKINSVEPNTDNRNLKKASGKVQQRQKKILPERVEPDDEENDSFSESDDSTTEKTTTFHDKLVGNLKGSRFRFLNEILYSSDGSGGMKLFTEDRGAFKAYHEGYRQQIQQWPMNPLDRIIKSIKKMPKNYVVADFGCGEGRLAKAIQQKTYSLDLVAHRHEIIACDMANTPLEANSIDVAVYCLSLMGTNLKDFLLEANRVMKLGGSLKIAEVESRFADVRQFIDNVKMCGFQLINQDASKNLFVFMNFKKVKNLDKNNKKIPNFSLKPCLYKKR